MQYTKLFNRGAFKKTGLTSVLLVAILPGIGNVPYRSIQNETEHVQRAIQLANEREMIGDSDSIRLTASAIRRKTATLHDFVTQYVSRSIRPEWKASAPKIARAVLDASVRHGFDPILLLALIQNESRFDPVVVGGHGEIGLMQIKPDTAEWVAKKSRIRWHGADMLRDPVANIKLGSAYLSMLRAKFGFEKDLYLAAYNMGARNLNRLLSSNIYPQTYPQRTIQHYSQIYLEFLEGQKPAGARVDSSLAAI